MPAISVKSTPPPSMNFPTYISSFAGTSFLSPLPPYPQLHALRGRDEHSLMPATYLRYFSNLLLKELSSQHETMRQYDMYNVPLYAHDLGRYYFKLMVPGIREDCPMVAVGDIVHLRQIRTNGYNVFPPAGFTGTITYYPHLDRMGEGS